MRVNGWILFAAFMMMFGGTMAVINGLIAIIDDSVFVSASEDASVITNYETWGWVHLILGTIVVCAGFALLGGSLWARIVAAILAGLSILSQIAFIQAHPFWSLAIIGIDIAIIWSVCTMGRADEEIDLTM